MTYNYGTILGGQEPPIGALHKVGNIKTPL